MVRIYLLVILAFQTPLSASAEYCDMIGANQQVEWIHIPETQYLYPKNRETTLNGTAYRLDLSQRLFVDYGLPEVNATAILNHVTASTILPECLAQRNCSPDEMKRYSLLNKEAGLLYANGSASINTTLYYCNSSGGRRGCWDLSRGATLKIISYTSINSTLFALVQVLDCPS